MKNASLNGKRTFAFASKMELIDYVKDKKEILIAINTEKILDKNDTLTNIINRHIGYPDGMGAVMALKRKGIDAVKIRGAELWLDIVQAFYKERSIYLIGAREEIMNQTVQKLANEFPGIKIAGFHHGYFDNNGRQAIKEDIYMRKPDIVFIALGSPKQEYFMAELFAGHPALYMGLGGSYDLYCGKTKPVPAWWSRYFVWEGLYRAFDDFRNIRRWKRQIPATRILYKILFNRL